MLTSLMSLTMTATRRPSRLARMWLSSVVLPAPRKPERTVGGARHGSFAQPSPAAESASKVHWLVGRSGDVAGKTFHIGQRTVTMGRGVSNFVQVVDDRVSRVHCQIVSSPEGVRVKDLDSTTGTLLNGEPIQDAVILQTGDQLRIGDAVLEYWYQGDFEHNAALDKKESGADARMATQAVDLAGNMKQTASRALAQHNGDIKKAAESLGVSPEFLMQLLNS
jgi:hypothetical protein